MVKLLIFPSWYVWHLLFILPALATHRRPFLLCSEIRSSVFLKQQLYFFTFLWRNLPWFPNALHTKFKLLGCVFMGLFSCFNYFPHKYSDLAKLFYSPASKGSLLFLCSLLSWSPFLPFRRSFLSTPHHHTHKLPTFPFLIMESFSFTKNPAQISLLYFLHVKHLVPCPAQDKSSIYIIR